MLDSLNAETSFKKSTQITFQNLTVKSKFFFSIEYEILRKGMHIKHKQHMNVKKRSNNDRK